MFLGYMLDILGTMGIAILWVRKEVTEVTWALVLEHAASKWLCREIVMHGNICLILRDLSCILAIFVNIVHQISCNLYLKNL